MDRARDIVRCFLVAALLGSSLSQLGCRAACKPGTTLINGTCVGAQAGLETATEPTTNSDGSSAGATGSVQTSSTPNITQAGGTGADPTIANAAQTANSAFPNAAAGPASAAPSSNTAGMGSAQNQAGNTSPLGPASTTDAGTPSANMSVNPDPTCVPTTEQCDGQDNDCDTVVDEEIEPMPCGKKLGICKPGTIQCRNGQWDDPNTQCQGAIDPTEEECDAARLDEDCNGIPNDGCACSDGEEMGCAQGPYTCKQGTVTCRAGKWSSCQGEEKGSAEKCDGEDNDCDGTPDNGGDRLCSGSARHCGGARGCVACLSGDHCPAGDVCTEYSCTGNKCVPEILVGKACGTGNVCDSRGSCSKACGNGTVDSGEECDSTTPSCDPKTCKKMVPHNASCSPSSNCGTDGVCANTNPGMPLNVYACYKSCPGTGASTCSTWESDDGRCFSGMCLQYCGNCVGSGERGVAHTCTKTKSCPGTLTCVSQSSMIGDSPMHCLAISDPSKLPPSDWK